MNKPCLSCGADADKACADKCPSPMPPPVPERILCMPFWRPYGAMVVDRVKTIETRARPWDKPPAWIAVYNGQVVSKLQDRAATQPGAAKYMTDDESVIGPSGVLLGLMHVTGSRLLALDDVAKSFFFEPGRFAWFIDRVVCFSKPLPMQDAGMKRAPQGAVYIESVKLAKSIEEAWA